LDPTKEFRTALLQRSPADVNTDLRSDHFKNRKIIEMNLEKRIAGIHKDERASKKEEIRNREKDDHQCNDNLLIVKPIRLITTVEECTLKKKRHYKLEFPT
jgi:hypothetical protein